MYVYRVFQKLNVPVEGNDTPPRMRDRENGYSVVWCGMEEEARRGRVMAWAWKKGGKGRGNERMVGRDEDRLTVATLE